jgi:hypothetical protein
LVSEEQKYFLQTIIQNPFFNALLHF